jgi:TRAP-type C4-dicarboxylate transport system substrate-binding protein
MKNFKLNLKTFTTASALALVMGASSFSSIALADTTKDQASTPNSSERYNQKDDHSMKHNGMMHHKQNWDNLSEEEKAKVKAHKKEMKDKWNNMSAEEKAEVKEKMKERKEAWRSLSDEQRQDLKNKMEEGRENWDDWTPEEKKKFRSDLKNEWNDMTETE